MKIIGIGLVYFSKAGIDPAILAPDMLQNIAERYVIDYTALSEDEIKDFGPE